MSQWFVPTETVINPESRETLLLAGDAYSLSYVIHMADEHGFDNVAGVLVTAVSARQAEQIVSNR